jgi:sporulation protein YlmC with PRC-barrel domain
MGGTMRGTSDPRELEGREIIGQDGEKIGTVGEVYVNDGTGAPEFALVKSGLFGIRRRFVPIRVATDAGDRLEVPYTKDMVDEAPSLETDGHLSEAEEDELYRYYGIHSSATQAESSRQGEQHRRADRAMTRSEEEVEVGTHEHDVGRVRLRKYVETENVTTSVPVKKEAIREGVRKERIDVEDPERRV